MQHTTEPQRLQVRVIQALKEQLAGRGRSGAEYYRRRRNWHVSVHTDREPVAVTIIGPRVVQDDELRAALGKFGYQPHDFLHTEHDSGKYETVAYLYGE